MDFIVLLFSLVLLKIPFLFETGVLKFLVFLTCMMPFWIAIAKNSLRILSRKKSKLFFRIQHLNSIIAASFSTFTALLIITISRGILNGALSFNEVSLQLINWTTIIAFGLTLFLAPRGQKDDLQLRKGILYAIGIYVCLNVILELTGVDSSARFSTAYQNETAGKSTMLSFFGVDRDRVFFPLANGVNSFGIVAGASLVTGTGLISRLVTKKIHIIIAAIISLSSLYAVILTDSRGSLLWALVAICLINLTPINLLQKLPWIALFSPILPLLSMMGTTITFASGLFDLLSRNANDLQELGGRLLIWNNVALELSNPSVKHLIGYGVYGQAASGISSSYFEIASGYANPDKMSVHNFCMQYILDMGYLGTALFIMLLFLVLKQVVNLYIHSEYRDICRVSLGVLFFLILSSTNEVALTIYNPEVFTIFIFIVISNLRKVSQLKQIDIVVNSRLDRLQC